MRIIIEPAEQGRTATPSYEPTHPVHVETVDGGAPSHTLTQTVEETLPLPMAMEREGMSAGPPPEWLLKAIQGSAQPSTAGSGMDTDAGSAPNER